MIETVHAGGDNFGFIYNVVVDGPKVYACGGTYYKPTLLYSKDHGRSFTAWKIPKATGLRDVCVEGKRVWIAGEYGMVASTTNQGKTWKTIEVPGGRICLYQIDRDASGALWILGDNGEVLRRGPKAKTFKRVKNHSKGRMLKIVFDPRDGAPWLLDDPGYLQRWNGKKFVLVPVGKVRNKRILTCITRTRTGALILVGDKGLLLRSTDGKTWKKPKHPRLADALEDLHITKYGILAAGDHGLMLVSNDDGLSWRRVDTGTTTALWCFADVEGGLVIGGDHGEMFRFETHELAKLLSTKDPVIAALAARVSEREAGAEMVLEDALRERDLWG